MAQVIKEFYDNGYGVSVINDGYGAPLYELAVLKGNDENWDLCYDTSITSDVLGWLSWEEVQSYIEQVKALEPA